MSERSKERRQNRREEPRAVLPRYIFCVTTTADAASCFRTTWRPYQQLFIGFGIKILEDVEENLGDINEQSASRSECGEREQASEVIIGGYETYLAWGFVMLKHTDPQRMFQHSYSTITQRLSNVYHGKVTANS